MIVEATLNDGDFGVITFDPWYDSEGPIYSLSDDVAYVFCLISQNQSGFLVEKKLFFADFRISQSKHIWRIIVSSNSSAGESGSNWAER